jgi:hypothetical protein
MSDSKILIPKGFHPIAIRDDIAGNCVISYHLGKKQYFLAINGKGLGPINLNDMKQLVANMIDVIDLKGIYIYLDDEYSADGTKKTI